VRWAELTRQKTCPNPGSVLEHDAALYSFWKIPLALEDARGRDGEMERMLKGDFILARGNAYSQIT